LRDARQSGLRRSTWPAWFAAVLVVGLGGALRFETLVTRYWEPQGAPSWALHLRDVLTTLHPRSFTFAAQAKPYEGDPFSYLRFAREDHGFYDAHVREPLFLAAARLGLRASGGQDIGLNFASAFFGTVLVAATFLLGARAASPWVGIAAATLLAIERHAVGLSVEGWRDDTFASFAVLSAWALLGLLRRPSASRAVLVGVLGAASCLTRLTSLAFLLPAWGFIVLRGHGEARARRRAVLISVAVSLAFVVPYLMACAIAFGDPLYAINYHTGFYRSRAGLDGSGAMGWTDFLRLGRGPFELLDTMLLGLTSVPFSDKWIGFRNWSPALGPSLAWASVVGLLLWASEAEGLFLLLLLTGLLLPYSATWGIPGGNEWRFTLPAYPLYLVAAASVFERAARWLKLGGTAWIERFWQACRRALVTIALGAAALTFANLVHFGRIAEDTQRGGSALIEVGARDGLFFTDGWAWPERRGNFSIRRTRAGYGLVELPLPADRDVALTLRLDVRGATGRLDVSLNGAPLATLTAREGARVGAYPLRLPAERLVRGRNRIELRAAPGEQVSLWYVQVETASVVAKGLHGLELRRVPGGIEAEADAHQQGRQQGQ